MRDLIGSGGVAVESGQHLLKRSGGKWAAEQMMKAANAGIDLSPAVLRTADTLRAEEWRYFDEALVQEALIQLRGVADLYSMGLTRPVANAMGKTVFSYEKLGFMDPASVSMDGVSRTENDRLEFELANLPLPITHKDFYINLRTLVASRQRGESLDTTSIRTAGRVVAEMAEQMLFQGGKVFGGMPIYGYTTVPTRNTISYGTGGNWNLTAKTGAQYLADLLAMIGLAQGDRMYGPYMLYVPRDVSVLLDNDFKSLGSDTIRKRLLMVEGLLGIKTVDQLPTGNVVLVQMTSDTVVWVDGETLQTVQWDVEGGFHINFKAFQIGVPLVRADFEGRSGIVHMS
jgi:hypothetical protein